MAFARKRAAVCPGQQLTPAFGREAAVRRNVRSWGVKPTSRSHSRTSGFAP